MMKNILITLNFEKIKKISNKKNKNQKMLYKNTVIKINNFKKLIYQNNQKK